MLVVVDALIALLNDVLPAKRYHAVSALVRIIKGLRIVTGSGAQEARHKIKNITVVDKLISMLYEPEPELRRIAAEALGEIPDSRCIEPLSTLLEDIDPFVREQAVITLGKIKDERVLPLVREALFDEAENVRNRAAEFLGLSPTSLPKHPDLADFGLSKEIQHMLKLRQGWEFRWNKKNRRYTILQMEWDKDRQEFVEHTVREIGWIDENGNLHVKVSKFSAVEGPNGKWEDTSSSIDACIPLAVILGQLADNFSLTETKNPAFKTTGILTLRFLEQNIGNEQNNKRKSKPS